MLDSNLVVDNGVQSNDCLFCVTKHICAAFVLLLESHQGYIYHRWLAVGNLVEAERESLGMIELHNKIRRVRLAVSGQSNEGWCLTDITSLIIEVRKEAEKYNGFSEIDHYNKTINLNKSMLL